MDKTMAAERQEEPISSSASREKVRQQDVVVRLTNLPLVSSAYDMAASAYASTKEHHPYVKAVLDLAEKGMKHVSSVATSSVQPLLMKLGPQVAGQYASMGLDKLEETLPILHQTADQVISDLQELVSAKVGDAKGAVTKAVQSGKEVVVGMGMGKMASNAVDVVLEKSEELLDRYLPMMDEELAELAESTPGGVNTASEDRGYFVRLGSLSNMLRHRSYQHAVANMKIARSNIREAFSRLQQYIGQIEHTKEDVVQEGQEKLYQIETVAMSSRVTEQLKMAFRNLIANIQGLPVSLQHNLQQTYLGMEELHVSFANAKSFHDLSNILLSRRQDRFLKAQDCVEGVLEYVVNNTPLSWLVGPLAPGLDKPGDIAEHKKTNDGQRKVLNMPEQ